MLVGSIQSTRSQSVQSVPSFPSIVPSIVQLRVNPEVVPSTVVPPTAVPSIAVTSPSSVLLCRPMRMTRVRIIIMMMMITVVDNYKRRACDRCGDAWVCLRVRICHGDNGLVNTHIVHENLCLVNTIALVNGSGRVHMFFALVLFLLFRVQADQRDPERVIVLGDRSSVSTSALECVPDVGPCIDFCRRLELDSRSPRHGGVVVHNETQIVADNVGIVINGIVINDVEISASIIIQSDQDAVVATNCWC